MAIARSGNVVFLGTSESSLASIANNASSTTGSYVDLLGNDTTAGYLDLYLVLTSTVTAGSFDVTVNMSPDNAQSYVGRAAQFSIPPISGTQKLFLGTMSASRYATVTVLNNATGASGSVFVRGEVFTVS